MSNPHSSRIAGLAPHLLSAAAVVVVLLTRWPFRSDALFSWDSANFALAMARIDIGAHRPHPPGYLGYVLAARAIDGVIHDPNTSLVLWNIAATAAAAVVFIYLAWGSAEETAHRITMTIAAGALFVTGPLLWFYGEIAEIYPSELLVVLLVAFTALRTVRGRHVFIYWCAVALALAVAFKVTAALLMLPLTAYAWISVPSLYRRRSVALLVLLFTTVAVGFLIVQPDLPEVIFNHFVGSTAGSRLIGSEVNSLKSFNRNVRDTFLAAVSGLGAAGSLALVAWVVSDRRLPRTLGRSFVVLWLMPWLVLVLAVHIGKPGYILPIVPLGVLILANFYSRQRTGLAAALITFHVVGNVVQFAWLTPLSSSAVGGSKFHRDKTYLEQLLSDLQQITHPTAFTIADSERRVAELQELVISVCAGEDPIIVAGMDPVDWRRVMWYFPGAQVVFVDQGAVLFVARHTDVASVTASGIRLSTTCPVIWLSDDGDAPGPFTPAGAVPVPRLGSMSRPGTMLVTPERIRLEIMSP